MKLKFPSIKLLVAKLFCKPVLALPAFPLGFPLSAAFPHAPALPNPSFLVPARGFWMPC